MAKLTEQESRRLMGSAYGAGGLMDNVVALAEQLKDEGKLDAWFEERDRMRDTYAKRQDALAEGELALAHHEGAHKDALPVKCPLCAPRISGLDAGLKVTALQKTILLDPELRVWNVVVQRRDGEWRESFGTEEGKDAFLRGLTAASVIWGRPEPFVHTIDMVDREGV